MAMKNKIADLIERKDITKYRFWKDTGLSRPTAYKLANDRSYIPSGETLDAICCTYNVQPGDILEWVPDEIALSNANGLK